MAWAEGTVFTWPRARREPGGGGEGGEQWGRQGVIPPNLGRGEWPRGGRGAREKAGGAHLDGALLVLLEGALVGGRRWARGGEGGGEGGGRRMRRGRAARRVGDVPSGRDDDEAGRRRVRGVREVRRRVRHDPRRRQPPLRAAEEGRRRPRARRRVGGEGRQRVVGRADGAGVGVGGGGGARRRGRRALRRAGGGRRERRLGLVIRVVLRLGPRPRSRGRGHAAHGGRGLHELRDVTDPLPQLHLRSRNRGAGSARARG